MIAVIPSPTVAVWHLGPLAIRAYALCILAGIVVAVWSTQKRLEARGGQPGQALDVSAWAVPFGIVGGRVYHVITTPQPYFGENGDPIRALFIWQGGLGIWGAVALGAVGAWIGCRRTGVRFADFADSCAPGIAVAQALGRWGNWFNNELHGGPTDLPWGLRVYDWDQGLGRARLNGSGDPIVLGTFHPTFLYESIWCLVLAALLVWLGRRRRFERGQVFALYICGYTVVRLIIETMRTDEANLILGQRLNVWTSILVFLFGVVLYWRAGVRGRSSRSDPDPDPEPEPGDVDGDTDEAQPQEADGVSG